MTENKNKQVKKSVGSRIRNYFFTGILVTAPAAITIYLAVIFINYVDSHVIQLIPTEYNPETYLPFSVPGIGLFILFIFFVLIGMFAAGFIGRFFVRVWERILESTPIVSSVYNALKQIFETFFSSSAKTSFREVVMIQYPRCGIWTLAFITGTPTEEMKQVSGEDLVSIFVPTTPNPTSGFLLFIPRKDIIPLSISVEEGLKMVISVGIVNPDSKPKKVKVKKLHLK